MFKSECMERNGSELVNAGEICRHLKTLPVATRSERVLRRQASICAIFLTLCYVFRGAYNNVKSTSYVMSFLP